MVHPTRTNLLLLKEKSRSVQNSNGILKARRQALIKELLAASAPFLSSRDTVRIFYGHAVCELAVSLAIEGSDMMDSIAAVAERDLGVEVSERNVMGLRYREVTVRESPLRPLDGRGYDYRSTTPRMEEALNNFEQILHAMLEIAVYESKLKCLGQEVMRITRRIRVLEERILPDLQQQVKAIAQFLGERERESSFRLKRFKNLRLN
ncbi:MAG: V-type ATP synthase subunit D [Kiritimatiellae bacterium]|nr:V-type ATP synthase subunit D [Kiritimatiellia bacterium]